MYSAFTCIAIAKDETSQVPPVVSFLTDYYVSPNADVAEGESSVHV